MTASDDARQAISAAPLGPPGAIEAVLAAKMPDGRTIAQHLDDGTVAEQMLRRFAYPEDDEYPDGGWSFGGFTDKTENVDLLTRLEARP